MQTEGCFVVILLAPTVYLVAYVPFGVRSPSVYFPISKQQNATPLTTASRGESCAWLKTEMAHTHIGMNRNRIELFLTQQLVVVGVVVLLM